MFEQNAGCLVGLITIDEPSGDQLGPSCPPAGEATLGEFLLFLAGSASVARCVAVDEQPGALACSHPAGRLATPRFQATLPADVPTRLSANLENLAAELALANAQARRKIAAALLASR